jgi:hypothetical protein
MVRYMVERTFPDRLIIPWIGMAPPHAAMWSRNAENEVTSVHS